MKVTTTMSNQNGETVVSVESINGVGSVRSEALRSVGIETVEDVREASVEQLEGADGVGTKTAKTLKDEVEEGSDDDAISRGVDSVAVIVGNDLEDARTKVVVQMIEVAMQESPYKPETIIQAGDGMGGAQVSEWRQWHNVKTEDDFGQEIKMVAKDDEQSWSEAYDERDAEIASAADAVVGVGTGDYIDYTLDVKFEGLEQFYLPEVSIPDDLALTALESDGRGRRVAIVDGPNSYNGMYDEGTLAQMVQDALDEAGIDDVGSVGHYARFTPSEGEEPIYGAESWMTNTDGNYSRQVFEAPFDEVAENVEAFKLQRAATLDWADDVIVVGDGEYTDFLFESARSYRTDVWQVAVYDGVTKNPKPQMEEDNKGGPSKTERTANSDPAQVEEEHEEEWHRGQMDTLEARNEDDTPDGGAGSGVGSAGRFRSGQ